MSQLNNLLISLTTPSSLRWVWLALLLLFLILTVKIIHHLTRRYQPELTFVQNLKTITKPLIAQLITVLTLAAITLYIFIPAPDIIHPNIPLFDPVEISDTDPFVVEFDRPLSHQIQPSITPNIPGEWHYSSSKYLIFPDTLTFTPQQSLDPNTEYSVTFSRVLPISWVSLKQAQNILFVFKTPELTSLASLNPADQSNEINPNQPITLTFNQPNADNIDWTYTISPSITNQISYNADQTQLTITPQGGLNPATTYQLQVFRQPITKDFATNQVVATGTKELVSTTSFTTASHASIDTISPSGENILPNQPLTLTFQNEMNQSHTQTAFKLEPQTPGIFSWQGNDRLTFIPQDPWQFDTQYTLTLDQSAQTLAGGTLSDTITHTFKTIGNIQMLTSTPLENAIHPTTDPIRITFNQPVNQTSAKNAFAISPDVAGTISWQDNTFIFTPTNPLPNSQAYTISFAPGISSAFNTKTDTPLQLSFTTTPNRFELQVPLYKQSHTFTCFTTSSQMALAYKGVTSINEVGFLDEIGFDTTTRNFTSNTWGDPNKGVVGSYDGSGNGGYGAHWQPVSDAISKYRPTQIQRNWNLKDLLTEVSQGNPVMVWWVNGVWPAKDTSWKTPSGETVYTVNGMHVEVVRGWIGDINNPDYILTNDPWRGQRQYTPEQFHNLWQWFDNTAVIVR